MYSGISQLIIRIRDSELYILNSTYYVHFSALRTNLPDQFEFYLLEGLCR